MPTVNDIAKPTNNVAEHAANAIANPVVDAGFEKAAEDLKALPLEGLSDSLKDGAQFVGNNLNKLGKAVVPVSIGVDALRMGQAIHQDGNKFGSHAQHTAFNIAGGILGAVAGAAFGEPIGAIIGGGIGLAAGGPAGLAVGGGLGAIGGGVAGSIAGSQYGGNLGTQAADELFGKVH